MAKEFFEVKNLKVSTDGTELLHGVIFSLPAGSTTLLTGANGAGKSTLLKLIMGISPLKASGKILLNGKDITKLEPEERAKLGIFLSFQEPVAIPGLSVSEMLRSSTEALGHKMSYMDFKVQLYERIEQLGLDPFTAQRDINTSFSGGEKKKLEVFQMAMLNPKIAVLDETDSGLDIDALRIVAEGVNKLKSNDNAFIVITHYQRLLDYITPDVVHVLYNGRIIKTGDKNLALELEKTGYDELKKQADEMYK
jgi:Fe-S cluster assembly ATP-binding protein